MIRADSEITNALIRAVYSISSDLQDSAPLASMLAEDFLELSSITAKEFLRCIRVAHITVGDEAKGFAALLFAIIKLSHDFYEWKLPETIKIELNAPTFFDFAKQNIMEQLSSRKSEYFTAPNTPSDSLVDLVSDLLADEMIALCAFELESLKKGSETNSLFNGCVTILRHGFKSESWQSYDGSGPNAFRFSLGKFSIEDLVTPILRILDLWGGLITTLNLPDLVTYQQLRIQLQSSQMSGNQLNEQVSKFHVQKALPTSNVVDLDCLPVRREVASLEGSSGFQYVYVMSNPYQSFLKIGYTSDPERRVKELYDTNTASPNVIEYAIKINDARLLESRVHKRLAAAKKRVSSNREFFDVTLEEALENIRETANILANRNGFFIAEEVFYTAEAVRSVPEYDDWKLAQDQLLEEKLRLQEEEKKKLAVYANELARLKYKYESYSNKQREIQNRYLADKGYFGDIRGAQIFGTMAVVILIGAGNIGIGVAFFFLFVSFILGRRAIDAKKSCRPLDSFERYLAEHHPEFRLRDGSSS